jgi:mannose-6-phosphate isomerase-like protein (cupin superfamily)
VSCLTARRAALLCLAAGLACSPAAQDPPRLDVLLDTRIALPLSELAARVPLEPGQPFRAVELGRSEHTSHHVAALRGAEAPHRHDRHDLVVVMLRGHGAMRLGDEERAVGEGSILYVPRGTVHAFRNASPQPAAAYAVYTPAFDGVDRVPVE